MNERDLNRRLAKARGAAGALEPLLQKAWAAVITAVAQQAAQAFTARATLVAAAAPEWFPPPPGELFDPAAAEKAAAKTRRPRERILEQAASLEGIAFDIRAAVPQAFLDSLGARADTVIAGIRPAVMAAIEQGFDEGLSVPDTAALIREDVAALRDWQAAALARTDLNAIANAGNHLAVLQLNAASKQAGEQQFQVKRWLTADDERVRDAHREAEGQEVPVEQPFHVGGEALRFPGDPLGSPENVWNCRCTVIYAAEVKTQAAAAKREFAGKAIKPAETYYHGSGESGGQKLSVGNPDWDSRFFITPEREVAERYADRYVNGTVREVLLARDARVFRPILAEIDYTPEKLVAVLRQAEAEGFDAVHFGGGIGTVVLNEAKVISGGRDLAASAAPEATVTPDGGDQMKLKDTPVALRAEPETLAVTVVVADDTATDPAAAAVQTWTADLAFEGVPTDDGRWMAPGSLTWREPPMTLLALTENTEGGHLGADSAGSIQAVEKTAWTDADTFVVRGSGVFDSGEFGQETARMVEEGTLGYVSVDLAIREDGFRDPDTGEILDPAVMTEEQWMEAFMGGLQYAVLDGVIGAATVVPFSAFAESRISMSAGGEKHLALLAPIRVGHGDLLACAAGPIAPPADWFSNPGLRELTPLTVTEDGRVYGHAATWDCHNGFADRCLRASPSRSGYAGFHTGQIRTAEGALERVGRVTVKPHAPYGLAQQGVSAHYDDASRVAAFVRAYDDGFGIAVAGVTRSDAPPELLRDFLANPPSGDWRQGELLGFSSVAFPGLPVAAPEARLVASAGGEMEVDTLLLPPVTEADILLASITGDSSELALVIESLAAAIAGDEPAAALESSTPGRIVNEPEPAPPKLALVPPPREPLPELAASEPEIDPAVEKAIEQLRLVTQRERFEGYKLGMDLGILSLNDCLAAEGREPIEGDGRLVAEEALEQSDVVTPALVAALEAITVRLAAGDRLNEGMVQALRDLATRPPRKLTVERDADGHAVAYQEA